MDGIMEAAWRKIRRGPAEAPLPWEAGFAGVVLGGLPVMQLTPSAMPPPVGPPPPATEVVPPAPVTKGRVMNDALACMAMSMHGVPPWSAVYTEAPGLVRPSGLLLLPEPGPQQGA